MAWRPNVNYEFGPFRVDARERQLSRAGEVVPLRPKVFDLLLALVQNNSHVISKDEMMKLVWRGTVVEEGNIARNISTLRTALGEQPRAPKYIETIPWRGYRFIAKVKEVRDESPGNFVRSIAVLPLVNVAADPDLDYLADGIAEALINRLSQLTQLKVMSRNSSFRYKARDADAILIGRELRVEAFLTGRVVRHDDLLSVAVELVDTGDGSHHWGAQYIRQPADVFELQNEIARQITNQLRVELTGDEQQRLAKRHTANPAAYRDYLKGRFYFNKLTFAGVQKGIDFHQQAVNKDTEFALAYAGLADCYNYLELPAEAKQAINRALELDETLGEAYATRGFFRWVYDWDFARAENDFERARELNPNYAEAHHWSALYSANVGRHAAAAAHAKKAVELDPLSLLMNLTPGLTAYMAREYERAIAELRKVLEMDPNFAAAHSVLGNAYLQHKQFDKAMAAYKKVLELSKGVAPVEISMNAIIAHAYAKSGQRAKATRLLSELLTMHASGSAALSPHLVGEIYGALGLKDEAFAWLNKAFEKHDMQLVSLQVNPTLDPLRSDPRFAELVRRVGLA